MEKTDNNLEFETQSIGKLMKKYSLPCIISLLVGALYNIVDQIFIANAAYLGSYGNAANTVVFPLTVIALAVAAMIGDGCCAFVSISMGAKQEESAHKGVGNAVVFTVAVSLIITAVYFLFSDKILLAFGANINRETFEFSKEYFFYISTGIPFYMFSQAVNPIIRADGSPGFAMAALICGAVCNAVLDPIFIFCFKWGMMGAAVATVLGQILSSVLSVIYLFRMKLIKLEKRSFKPDKNIILKIIPLGGASFLAQISIVFSMAAVLNVCKKYGAVDPVFKIEEYAQIPTAVIGIVMKFFQIVISASVGLAAGCIPIVGYNAGAKRCDRLKELLKKLIIAQAVLGAAAMIVFECFPAALINIFGAQNESVHYTNFAMRSIRLLLAAIVLACVNKGVFIYLQALGKAFLSAALSVLREIVFGVGLVILLPVWFGLDGVLYFMALADIFTFVAVVIVISGLLKKLNKGII